VSEDSPRYQENQWPFVSPIVLVRNHSLVCEQAAQSPENNVAGQICSKTAYAVDQASLLPPINGEKIAVLRFGNGRKTNEANHQA
jgi:hypothetical protein